MKLLDVVREAIEREAKRLAEKFQLYHNRQHQYFLREEKRVTNPIPKVIYIPSKWKISANHNPFHVLSRLDQIAFSITRSLISGTYKPRPPFRRPIKKNSGGNRIITEFEIPDAAISTLYYEKLLSKNRHRFSSYAYAYRDDRNVHFALQDLALHFKASGRLYLAEYDFSKYFSSIDHKFLFEQLDNNGFMVTNAEKLVIKSFITCAGNYRGIPEGTSLSLFLANVACWKLDQSLELEGLKFARYADDTFIWSDSYEKICKGYQAIAKFSKESTVEINVKKSNGISLLVPQGLKSEFHAMATKFSTTFLGYEIALKRISISKSNESKIKSHIGLLIYKNLIEPLKNNTIPIGFIPANNVDYGLLVTMGSIRRYLYGNFSEEYVRGFVTGKYSHVNFRGLMSFYPLVDDLEQLGSLDGWLINVLHRAVKWRYKMYLNMGFPTPSRTIYNVKVDEFVIVCKSQIINGKKLYMIPSFRTMAEAIKKGLSSAGIIGVMHPESNKYNYR